MPNLNTLGVQPVNIGRIVQCETTRREQIILEKCIENEDSLLRRIHFGATV